jgi:anti-sigma factor RsiW
MVCPEFEYRLHEELEGRLGPVERAEVQAHLAACRDCRQWRAELAALDAALARRVRPPALPGGFQERVLARLEPLPAPASDSARAERRRQLEAEFACRAARLKQKCSAPIQYLDSVGYVALAILAATLLVQFEGGSWTRTLASFGESQPKWLLPAASVAGLAFLAAGLGAAFRNRWARFWA